MRIMVFCFKYLYSQIKIQQNYIGTSVDFLNTLLSLSFSFGSLLHINICKSKEEAYSLNTTKNGQNRVFSRILPFFAPLVIVKKIKRFSDKMNNA